MAEGREAIRRGSCKKTSLGPVMEKPSQLLEMSKYGTVYLPGSSPAFTRSVQAERRCYDQGAGGQGTLQQEGLSNLAAYQKHYGAL